MKLVAAGINTSLPPYQKNNISLWTLLLCNKDECNGCCLFTDNKLGVNQKKDKNDTPPPTISSSHMFMMFT